MSGIGNMEVTKSQGAHGRFYTAQQVFEVTIRGIWENGVFQVQRVGMDDEQVAAIGVSNMVRKGQSCQVVDASLSNLFPGLGNRGALLEAFLRRLVDHFKVDVVLDDGTR